MTANFAAKEADVAHQYLVLLRVTAIVFAVLFYLAQLVAAWYLTRTFLRGSSSNMTMLLKYLGMFMGSMFCSLCGAVACEAFGYALLIHVMRRGL